MLSLLRCQNGKIQLNARQFYPAGFIKFMSQVTTSCHKSKVLTDFFDETQMRCISDCPAQYPVLNIIGNLWGVIEDELRKPFMTGKDELISRNISWEYIQEE